MRRWWIVLLMVALLPLRGWAAVAMGGPALMLPAQAAWAAEPLPCHAAQPAEIPAPSEPGVAQASHLCTACDLCHSPLAVLAGGLAGPGAAPRVGPAPAQPRDTGRLLATCLERPPRA